MEHKAKQLFPSHQSDTPESLSIFFFCRLSIGIYSKDFVSEYSVKGNWVTLWYHYSLLSLCVNKNLVLNWSRNVFWWAERPSFIFKSFALIDHKEYFDSVDNYYWSFSLLIKVQHLHRHPSVLIYTQDTLINHCHFWLIMRPFWRMDVLIFTVLWRKTTV